MRGNAEMASQQQAKRLVGEQMDAAAKTSLTITPNGISIKNADPSLLNGTQQQDLDDAINTPHLSVAAAMDNGAQAAGPDDPLEPVFAIADKHLGFRVPRPSDPDIAAKLKTPEGIRELTIEMGGTPQDADKAIRALRDGRLTVSAMRERVAAYRTKKLAAIQDTIQKPLDEAQDIQKRASDLRTLEENQLRQREQDQRAERKDYLARLDDAVKNTDFSVMDPSEWRKAIEEQVGPVSDYAAARIERKGQQDVAKALNAFMNTDKDQLGLYKSFDEAKRSFGRTMTPQQEAQFKSNWMAARGAYTLKQEKDQAALRLTKANVAALERGNQIAQHTLDITRNSAGGEEALKNLPPETAQLVRKIANYEMDLSKVTSLRGGQRERIASLVAMYDPTFDMTQYSARHALRRDFTSGKGAFNIRSINTAVKHLESLSKAAKQLDNSRIQLWNRVANYAGTQTGDPRVTNFKSAANAVESEMASVFKGMGATDQEIKAWRENLNEAQSPEQLQGAIATMIELMGGRLSAMDSQWTANMGKPKDFRILSPESERILKQLGVDPTTMENGHGAETIQTEIGPDGKLRVKR